MPEDAGTEKPERSRLWLIALPVIYALAGPLVTGLYFFAWAAILVLITLAFGIPLPELTDFPPLPPGETRLSMAISGIPALYGIATWIYPTAGLVFVIIGWVTSRISLPIAVIANGAVVAIWIGAEVARSMMRGSGRGVF